MYGDTIAKNYREVQDCLTREVPFRHRSCSAHFEDRPVEDGQARTYVVLSYSTVVATKAPGEAPWLTEQKYSVTTSKQMGYIRRAWGVEN